MTQEVIVVKSDTEQIPVTADEAQLSTLVEIHSAARVLDAATRQPAVQIETQEQE